jgi:hypothetical protein
VQFVNLKRSISHDEGVPGISPTLTMTSAHLLVELKGTSNTFGYFCAFVIVADMLPGETREAGFGGVAEDLSLVERDIGLVKFDARVEGSDVDRFSHPRSSQCEGLCLLFIIVGVLNWGVSEAKTNPLRRLTSKAESILPPFHKLVTYGT